MSEGQGNIYEKKETARAEHRRLETFTFPSRASEQVVGEDLEGKVVLDVGSGPNTALGTFTREHGGTYVAFDVNQAFLKSQREADALAVRGSIENLPFKEADIVHTRFVLMHLSPEQRTKAIEQCTQVARERAVFLEYDWGTVKGGGPLIDAFKKFAIAFMEARHIDPFMGEKLSEMVRDAIEDASVKISERRISEGPGNYYGEFVPLAKAMKEVAIATKQVSVIAELEKLERDLTEEAGKQDAEPFERPDIVAVEVEK